MVGAYGRSNLVEVLDAETDFQNLEIALSVGLNLVLK